MPLFEITKPIYTTLIINCDTKEEAEKWASKIVGDLETENEEEEEFLSSNLDLFVACSEVTELRIEEIESDSNG